MPEVETVIARGTALPEFAWHCRLRNLPLALRPDLETMSETVSHYFVQFEMPLAYRPELAVIPGQVPYLAATPELAQAWAKRLGESGPRIGLNWAGSPITCAPVALSPGVLGVVKIEIATSTPASTPDAGAHLLSHVDI